MSARDLKASVSDRLARAGCLAADEEAEELLAAAPDAAALERCVVRRERGEPLAWIIGRITFCGVPVHVERGVFVPRPQSEELARRAARAVPVHGRVADLCSGAGAIAAAVTHLAPSASVAATDVDERAARCARRNGVDVLLTDIDGGLASRTFDVVTAVAPYVPSDAIRYLPADVQRFEPRAALDGGTDGLDIVRRVIAAAARLLIPGGSLFIELGADQATALGPVLAVYGFATPERWYDEDGDVRGMAALLIP